MKPTTRPLKVTAYLVSPLAGDPPFLDSLLEMEMMIRMPSVWRSSGGHRHETELRPDRRTAAPEPGKIPIPISFGRIGGLLVPRCSSPILGEVVSDSTEHFTRRTEMHRVDMVDPARHRKMPAATGFLKAYRLPLRVRAVDRVVWFAVGNGSDMRHLLKRVKAIGKKVAFGYGRVGSWSAEFIDDDLSWFATTEAGARVVMRPLPRGAVSGATGYRAMVGACQSPYWHPDRQIEVAVPC